MSIEAGRDILELAGLGNLGHQDAVGLGLGRGGEIVEPPLGVQRIDAHDHFARAKAAGRDDVRDLPAGGRLGIGRDRVLQIEDHRVAGQGLRLLQRARIGTGHVKHAAARTGGHVGILLWLSGSIVQAMHAADASCAPDGTGPGPRTAAGAAAHRSRQQIVLSFPRK